MVKSSDTDAIKTKRRTPKRTDAQWQQGVTRGGCGGNQRGQRGGHCSMSEGRPAGQLTRQQRTVGVADG